MIVQIKLNVNLPDHLVSFCGNGCCLLNTAGSMLAASVVYKVIASVAL